MVGVLGVSDKEFENALAAMLDDARTFREAVAAVKTGGNAYSDTWAMVSVVKAKEAKLI